MSVATKPYEVKADSQKRVVIQDVRFDRYRVEVHTDGRIFLVPIVQTADDTSPNEASLIEETLSSFKELQETMRGQAEEAGFNSEEEFDNYMLSLPRTE